MDTLLSNSDFLYINSVIAKMYADENPQHALKIFLEDLKELIPFEKGEIYFCNFQNGPAYYEDFIFCGWSKKDLEVYHKEEVYKMDEVLPVIMSHNPLVFRSSDVFIQSEREKTKYYQDVVRPIGMQYSIEGNIFFDNGCLSAISIHRSEGNDDFSPKALEIIKLVRPHLVNISKKYNDNKVKLTTLKSNDNFYIPLIKDMGYCLFDDNLEVIRMELSGLHNLLETSLLDQQTIIDNIKSILITGKASRNEDVAIRKEIVLFEHSYFLDISRCQSSDDAYCYIAVIYDFNNTLHDLVFEIKEKYNLSYREYDVLLCVIEGLDNAEISSKLFVSLPTTKKHLINIYRKLGIKNKHQVLSVVFNNDMR